ncbi:hypothetical protein J4734_22910 [Klebsiella pneumoniae]|uniref:Uncharacterized protein n=1 Tax=Klebsiella pneumoniae TaxID=573 RepID=A0A939SVQ0_KLEPN|nr:hypothetical protein [Klebsiella pneumoniae]
MAVKPAFQTITDLLRDKEGSSEKEKDSVSAAAWQRFYRHRKDAGWQWYNETRRTPEDDKSSSTQLSRPRRTS